MKRILDFSKFVNENYQPLNEGGGAGIDFKTSADVTLKLDMTADRLDETEKKIDVAETFDAHGYDDGMSEAGTWMFKSGLDIDYDKMHKMLLQIPIDSVQESREFLEEIGVQDDDKIQKLGDLFIAQPELVLGIKFDMSFKEYREMHFQGWVRGTFKEGDLVIGSSKCKYDNGDYDSVTISDGGNSEFELSFDSQVGELVDLVKPQLTATKTFVEFYEAVFNSHKGFEAFIKSELIDNDVAEGIVDDDIEEYIADKELDITLEEFKEDTKKYVTDDFVEFMNKREKYYGNKWDSYTSMLQDDYGKDNPGGLEQD